MNPFTILIVDDERTLARSIKLFLAEQGYEAEVAENGEKALELLERLRPDLVFLDVNLPGISGIDLLKRIKEYDRNIAVIIMTAYGSIEGAVEAVKLGAFDYIKKPVDLDELKLLADRALETSRLKQELSYYRQRDVRGLPIKGIIGKCEAIREIMERVQQIASLEETPPILITGETGTGKGLVARTIHSQSRRASRPFIEINCTALPATLMEAELFGYERGAFTDAKESKMGLFEAAEGGFLFLDEVGDIELPLQGKLLRAIEEQTVRRIGGLRDRRVDVRIVAATHRDLEREVKADRFRKDLYYRLAVITIDLPPLRERGEDILLLAHHFIDKFRAKYGKTVQGPSDQAARLLLEYPWPGNVRELSHVIERAVLWSPGERLAIEQLSLAPPIQANIAEPEPTTDIAQGTLPAEGIDLAEWERSLIVQALHEAGGNQTKAAKKLGISRDTLRYRLKKFGIDSSS
ncbi:MAG TPA: sigma-54 dependent transcriptional regulator [Candidatus Methylomirabilis sp.]|nr:sigma-54 dependent transcriptional regulator [Candidatus Methylomirabilis sp.]